MAVEISRLVADIQWDLGLSNPFKMLVNDLTHPDKNWSDSSRQKSSVAKPTQTLMSHVQALVLF